MQPRILLSLSSPIDPTCHVFVRSKTLVRRSEYLLASSARQKVVRIIGRRAIRRIYVRQSICFSFSTMYSWYITWLLPLGFGCGV